MKTNPLPVCAACGSAHCLEFDLGEGHLLKRCSECAVVSALEYVDPDEIYTEEYFLGQSRWGMGFDAREPHFQRLLARIADRRMSLIERVVGAPGRLLDVGSGMGEVLMCASRRGWLVQGVEPEHFAAETAIKRGVPTEAASLQESGVPEGNWDVVSAFHVLEHISDADGFLRLLARWANPGGHVVIEVPNFAGVQRRRRRQGWEHLRPMQHIAHYTPRTLAVTLQRSGLQPRLIQTPTYLGPPQDLDQAIYDLARGERLKRLLAPLTKPAWIAEREVRIPNRIGWLALRAIEEIYDRAGVGAVVLAVAQFPTQRRGQAAVATRPSALAAGRRVPRT